MKGCFRLWPARVDVKGERMRTTTSGGVPAARARVCVTHAHTTHTHTHTPVTPPTRFHAHHPTPRANSRNTSTLQVRKGVEYILDTC